MLNTFTFALGDGRTARGVVLDDRGKLKLVAHAQSGTAMLCSRRAFLDGVWRVDGRIERSSNAAIVDPESSGVYTPGAFERRVLARSGGERFCGSVAVVDSAPNAYADGVTAVRIRNARDPIVTTAVALDIAQVDAVPSLDALAALRALRLARIRRRIDLAAIEALRPSVLALEEVAVDDLGALAAWTWLEQLELRGFWHYNVRDVEWLMRLPNLVRLTLDLGGRRKNVEIYRRLQTAYAWPFDLVLMNAANAARA